MSGTFKKLAQEDTVTILLPPVHILKPFEEINNDRYIILLDSLSKAKDLLNPLSVGPNFYNTRYGKIIKFIDTYFGLKYILKSKFPFCTNASLKIHELTLRFELLKGTKKIFCNAELPGAFIAMIYRDIRGKCTWNASSYLPGGMSRDSKTSPDAALVNDWYLDDIYGLFRKYPNNWLMGHECDGDVTKTDTILYHASKVSCDLYTSDIGTDTSSDYNAQEDSTHHLNYGQIVDGLFTLADGGKLVTKQYTFSNPKTRSIMTVCAYLFEELYIVKPLTSRPFNSETYLVGKGFIKSRLTDDIRKNLLEKVYYGIQHDDKMYEATKKIHLDQQVKFLNEIIVMEKLIDNYEFKKRLNAFNNKKCEEWLIKYPIVEEQINL